MRNYWRTLALCNIFAKKTKRDYNLFDGLGLINYIIPRALKYVLLGIIIEVHAPFNVFEMLMA